VEYWQNKLKNNEDISFPETLVEEVADKTDRFSFAYLKEVFVSALMTTLKEHEAGHDVSFADCVRGEINELRKQLDKPKSLASTSTTQSTHESDITKLLSSLTFPPSVMENIASSSIYGRLISELPIVCSNLPVLPLNIWQDSNNFTGKSADSEF